MIQFPDAIIHKWVEGYELLTLISPAIKCKPAQQWKFPGKQGFFLVLKQPSPKVQLPAANSINGRCTAVLPWRQQPALLKLLT